MLHQRWSPEHIRIIIITIGNRQKTDKGHHTKVMYFRIFETVVLDKVVLKPLCRLKFNTVQ